MRLTLNSAALASLLLALPAVAAIPLNTDDQKINYIIGMNIGENLKIQDVPLDESALFGGIDHGYNGTDSLIDQAEVVTVMAAFEQKTKEKQAMQNMEGAAAGEAFLVANGQKEGVVTLDSGLQYKVITAGDGAVPTLSDQVTTHYKGTLINGNQFDSSYDRGQPATFPVSGVIRGWTEALQLMPVGSTWELYIPSDLAYGSRGAGGSIPPNSALIFQIELIAIK